MKKTITLFSTKSTNKDALALAEQGGEHGAAVIAATQTMGRGRLGKSWQSPPGKGLYCSIILRPNLLPQDYPLLTFVAGLAVAEVIEKLYLLSCGLKWPNDIYFRTRKCGGILTETSTVSGTEPERFAVVGIGVNVNTEKHDFQQDVRDTATSLLIESGKEYDINIVFREIRRELLHQVKHFEQAGFQPVIENWRKRDFLLGQRLAWVTVTGQKIEGISLGPDDKGLLHVRDDSGEVHEVLSGDIQLATR